MSNNLTRKGLAVSSGLAIALTSLVGVAAPASAAPGDVTISPSVGSNWAVFNHDGFEVDVTMPSYVEYEAITEGMGGLALTNSDGQAFWIDSLYDFDDSMQLISVDANGVVDVSDLSYLDETEGGYIVDFDDLNAVRVHIGYVDSDSFDVYPLIYSDETDATVDLGEYGYEWATFGDGDFALGFQYWAEITTNTNFGTIDASWASKAETINFYDPKTVNVTPRIERFDFDDNLDYLVPDGDGWAINSDDDYLGFSVGFSKTVNLDLASLEYWNVAIFGDDTDDTDSGYLNADDEFVQVALDGNDEADDAARAYFVAEDISLDGGDSYRINIKHSDASAADRSYTSGGYRVPTAPELDDTIGGVVLDSITDEVNSVLDDTTTATLRAGTKSFTYVLQLVDDSGDALEEANVPMMISVGADDYLADGATISLTSANMVAEDEDLDIFGYALSNAKGQATFTVTHSSATSQDDFFIEFWALDEDGDDDYATDYELTADYDTTTVGDFEVDTPLASGSKVNLTFSVTDQFGQPISKSGTKALNVLLTASDEDDLELSAAVDANGEAKFSFDNYLQIGETDALTGTLFTGSASAPVVVDLVETVPVDLFNTATPASVSVSASATAEVTYDDFITGLGTALTRPTEGEAELYTGSVLDANGAGIPGALVTVSATGFQFRKSVDGEGSGSFFKDSISVVADSQGQFSVLYWVHEASSTGKTLTVTSGGKTATTTVKTYLPEGLDGNNLKFELAMPKNVVKNTTYALVAKLTDKWGNPVATTTVGDDTYGVTFQGSGSVQINSVDTAVKRNFGRDGTVTVFMRSVKDIAGPGSVLATLGTANYKATSAATNTALTIGEIATDVTTTAWDETKFENEIEAEIEVLDVAPVTGKVNVGSFNGKLVVYAAGLAGAKISWKVGGVWGTGVASSNYAIFDRPTPRRGVTVTVDIYVNGVKQLTKSVVTR